MGERMVNCIKLGKEAPGLEFPPFEGDLGQEIYQKVSKEVWLQWADDLMIKIINEYRLDLSDEEHYNVLIQQMKTFLNLDSSTGEVLEVENEKRGRSNS